MIDDVLTDAGRRMDKSVEAAKHEFTTIRTGRASAALLDRIQVSTYGTKMPVNQLATISVPEPRLLTITPVRQEHHEGHRAGHPGVGPRPDAVATTARSSGSRSRSSPRSGARSS